MEKIKTEVIVVGAGPGGYAAAFYAADKGKKVVLVEQERLGGVCLNRGCIPSKALLHAAKIIIETQEFSKNGIQFGPPQIDLEKLRSWKDSILLKLSQGVGMLAQRRNVQVIKGRAYFEDSKTVRIETDEGQKFYTYDYAIIAVGSKPSMPRAFDLGNPRIMTSTEALNVEDIPEHLLVIGGGYIGMELGTVYSILGSKVVLAEALPSILAGADPDLAKPVAARAKKNFQEIRVGAKVKDMSTAGKKIRVIMEVDGQTKDELYDKVLVSVGRSSNSENLGLDNTLVQLDERGFIKVNEHQQTDDPNIYAIGDIVGGTMLAHKATKEARIAVEVICGEASAFEDVIIPAVVFTEPELAWCGLTEAEAKLKGIQVEISKFPWAASGRALTFDKTDGMTKLIVEPETERVLGLGIVGHNAGELIAEGVVLIEMGGTVRDLAECVHPHPTLSETLMEAAEAFYGYATHIYTRPKKTAE